IAQQNANVRESDNRQVRFAVAVEVSDRNVGWTIRCGWRLGCRLERPISVPEENAHVTVTITNNCQIEIAVMVKVGGVYRRRVGSGSVVYSWTERTIPISQQHSQVTIAGRRNCEIQVPVMIEIAHCDRSRVVQNREAGPCFKLSPCQHAR